MQPARLRRPAAAALAAAAALLAAAVAGCSSAPRAGDPPPDPERRFYEARCGVCHVPFGRSDFPPGAWPGIVAQFGPRAGLTPAQRERVLRYLTAPELAAAAR